MRAKILVEEMMWFATVVAQWPLLATQLIILSIFVIRYCTTTTAHQTDQSWEATSYDSWPDCSDDVYDGHSEAVDGAEPKEEATKTKPEEEEEDDDESLDATWRAMTERGVAKPVLKKSAAWEDGPRGSGSGLERAQRGTTKKSSAPYKEGGENLEAKKPAKIPATTTANREEGWRRREVLVVGADELFSRVETFIKRHYDHLKIQRQESEQRRYLEGLRRKDYFYNVNPNKSLVEYVA
ncbi:uncharacterized protein [Typha angustifolia]|uniref:uncharacterized protein n=1 Tax=Typha angustifolia TaxID=59011 RepID=UPI003C3001D2